MLTIARVTETGAFVKVVIMLTEHDRRVNAAHLCRRLNVEPKDCPQDRLPGKLHADVDYVLIMIPKEIYPQYADQPIVLR